MTLVVLAGVGALAYRLGSGMRYRLYTSPVAGDCWRAVELTTLSTSSVRLVSVAAPTSDAARRPHVSIDYTMDRVLGGKTLNVECVFAAGGDGLESIRFDGVALDAEALEDVNRELFES